MRRLNLERLRDVLLDSILAGDDTQTMFDKIYEEIKLPLNYFDTSFHLIANALPRPFYFEPWENMAKNRKATDDVVSGENYLEYQERMYNNKASLIFDYGTTEGFPQACGPVFQGKKLIGYMGTMAEDVFYEDVIAANDLIIEAIAILHRKENQNSIQFDEGFDIEELLLNGNIPKKFEEIFKMRYQPRYIYAILSSGSSSVTTLNYLDQMLKSNNEPTLTCLCNDSYLNVLQYNVKEHSGFSSNLLTLAKRYRLEVGISEMFSDIHKVNIYKKQAFLALSTKGCSKNSAQIRFFHNEYSHLISLEIFDKYPQLSCIQSEIKSLIRLDENTGTNYISTLKMYLDFEKKSSLMAERLNLHKNTIFRRIKQIEAITGLNLENNRLSNQIDLQLEILNTIRQFKEVSGE